MMLNDFEATVWGLWKQGRNTAEIAEMLHHRGLLHWASDRARREATVHRAMTRVLNLIYRDHVGDAV